MMGPTHAVWGAAAGLASVAALPGAHRPELLLLGAGVGLVGGLLPDIDHPPATIARPGTAARKLTYSAIGVKRHSLIGLMLLPLFWLTDLPVQALAHLFAAKLGHRGIMHSIGAGLIWAAVAGLGAVLLFGPGSYSVWAFLFAGYLSHLFTDGLTRSPQPIFFPLAWETDEVRIVAGRRQKRRRVVRLVPLLPAKLHLLPPGLRVAASAGWANAAASLVAILIIGGILAHELAGIHIPLLGR